MTTVPSYQKQPTLPHLLNEYGFQDAATQMLRKKKDEERERRKAAKKEKRKGESFSEEKDDDKRKEMEEHYIKIVQDMNHLRDYYYSEYTRLLSDKVEKQRRDMRQKDVKINLEKQKKEAEEKKATHKVKKRLERHTLSTTPSTNQVPKTDLYYIVGLEEKLKKEGKLKTPSDYQKFHNEIQQPHIFYSHFKVRKNTDTTPVYDGSFDGFSSSFSQGESRDTMFEMEPRPSLAHQSQQQQSLQNQLLQQPQEQIRSLSRISESRENSRPTSRLDNWAITQQFPAQYKNRQSFSSFNQPAKTQKIDQLSDLEKRFPKLEMPKLHCFTLNLAKKPPNPDEVKLKAELKAREKLRKQAGRAYTKMYQLAMSNAAATARILDTHEDMDLLLHGPDLCDVISDEHWIRAYGLAEIGQDHEAEEVQAEAENIRMIPPSSKSSSRKGSAASTKKGSKRNSRHSSAKSQKDEDKEEENFEEPTFLPLTMQEITNDCSIMEPKGLSSMWTNYLKAGKSPWDRDAEREDTNDDIDS